MGRAPCCDKSKVKRGPWSPDEDATLKNYLENYGTGGNWIALPHKAGLKRCGKSCRLRWLNYLRPNINHGAFTEEEDNIICTLYSQLGSRWSVIASKLQGRTDNDVKNHWNTKLKKKLVASKGNRTNNPNPSQSQSPINEAYNPHFSAMLSQISPAMPPPPPPTVGIYAQEGSSNISMDNNYGSPLFGNGGGLQDAFSMDFGSELISFDQMSGIWSQGTILEGANPNNGYANLVNPLYADFRPGVVCQNVTANQYY